MTSAIPETAEDATAQVSNTRNVIGAAWEVASAEVEYDWGGGLCFRLYTPGFS